MNGGTKEAAMCLIITVFVTRNVATGTIAVQMFVAFALKVSQ